MVYSVLFFQEEEGIRDLVRSRGLGDVYRRQDVIRSTMVWLPIYPHPPVTRIFAALNLLD